MTTFHEKNYIPYLNFRYNCEDTNCYSDLARLAGVKYFTWSNTSLLETVNDVSYLSDDPFITAMLIMKIGIFRVHMKEELMRNL